ncbi:Pole remodelling regulatory diguanylate cyclase [hydrothermal vent metagenome]|uniref:Pole remodelling regulatory diguanylate cyclase n=1 Tax=hydrothermal vent metagenome TaxID=652676 RepID=A0A3B1DKF0_9ZZZZ
MLENLLIDPQNSTLKEELNRAHQELAVLYDVSKAIQTSLELNNILYIILTGVTAHNGLGFNRAILFLANAQTRCLEAKMAIGPESAEHAYEIWQHLSGNNHHIDDLIQEEKITDSTSYTSSFYQSVKSLQIPLRHKEEDSNLLTKVYHEGKPLHINSDHIKQYAQDPLLQKFQTKELIIVPLKAKHKVNGLIVADNLYTQKSITTSDLKIFMMVANQAGLAIENARLYNIVRHKSRTDSLTKLWNHGFFQDQLTEEIDKVKKNKNSLSLILMDLDDFKKLNDTYGHHKGDLVLKEVSKILRDSSRPTDYVCRYGGEEFASILPNTTKKQALTIAERIRQRIAQHSFAQTSLDVDLTVTISIGVSSFYDDATKENLITESDRAMYRAKSNGRNQVFLA